MSVCVYVSVCMCMFAIVFLVRVCRCILCVCMSVCVSVSVCMCMFAIVYLCSSVGVYYVCV